MKKGKPYTVRELRYIQENYGKMNSHEIANKLQRDADSIRYAISKYNLRRVPRRACGFKGGYDSAKRLPDGSVTVTNRNGKPTKMIKQGGKWRPLHLVVWEGHYGKAGTGNTIYFIDDNRMNCKICNLEQRKK
jgi:hypothetical protein